MPESSLSVDGDNGLFSSCSFEQSLEPRRSVVAHMVVMMMCCLISMRTSRRSEWTLYFDPGFEDLSSSTWSIHRHSDDWRRRGCQARSTSVVSSDVALASPRHYQRTPQMIGKSNTPRAYGYKYWVLGTLLDASTSAKYLSAYLVCICHMILPYKYSSRCDCMA